MILKYTLNKYRNLQIGLIYQEYKNLISGLNIE